MIATASIPADWLFEKLLNLQEKLSDVEVCIRSPFSRDSDPSFTIYKKPGSDWRFMDFSSGEKGDATELFIALKRKENILLTRRAAKRLLKQMFAENGSEYQPTERSGVILNTKAKVTDYEMMKWTPTQLKWWEQWNISEAWLSEYNVAALKSFTMKRLREGKEEVLVFRGENYYGYFGRDGSLYKVYKPGSKPKTLKVAHRIQGLDQIKMCRNLLITKSLKDCLSFRSLEISEWDVISPDSENVMLKVDFVQWLWTEYVNIKVLFDNDDAGKKSMLKYQENFKIPPIHFDLAKDISDGIRDHSPNKVKFKLLQLL